MMDYKCWRCQKNYINQVEGWNYCPECGAPIQERHKTQHPHFVSAFTNEVPNGLFHPTGVKQP